MQKPPFLYWISGSQNLILGERVFNVTTFIGVIVSVLQSLQGLVISMHLRGLMAPVACVIAFGTVFFISRFKGGFKHVVWPIIIVSIIAINIQWFNVGGLDSSLPYMLVLVFIAFIVILPPKQHLFFTCIFLVNTLCLIGIQLIYPEWINVYPNPEFLKIDSSISLIITIIFTAILNSILKREYEQKRELVEQKNSALIKANSVKSKFLANMSHEIRTPMNGVIGMTELLSDSSLSTVQMEYVNAIETSGNRLLDIINQILDYSKIEAGEITLEKIEFNLRQCIEDVLIINYPSADKKGLELAYYIEEDCPEVIVSDEGKIRQILLNLVGNAIKFTSSGFVLVRIYNKPTNNADESSLTFCVEDSGIGIPKEKQKLLFKEFSQTDASTTRKFGGTGLGLAICRNLVEIIGGTIDVKSELNKGSSFYFTIPTKSIQSSKVELKPLTGKKILVAYKHPVISSILENILSVWKASPIIASTSEEAIQQLKTNSNIDLVLVDSKMEDSNGLTLEKRIESLDYEYPMIIFSFGHNLKKNKSDNIHQHNMLKPIRYRKLHQTILNLIDKQQTIKVTKVAKTSSSKKTTHNLSILVTDDERINQKLMQFILENLGHKVQLAMNGSEAVEMVQSNDFDVIFMDVQMPEMDGYEATKNIIEWYKKHPTKTKPPIIGLTANILQADKDKCYQAGMNDYMSKPVSSSLIEELITSYV